ncbi:TPA: hypothetical protein ACGO9Z_001449 [Streptococcus suis]
MALGAGVVILTIFCPPAGLTAGVVLLASADMYPAATGAKSLSGSVDDAVEAGTRSGDDLGSQILRNGEQFDEFGNLKPNAM